MFSTVGFNMEMHECDGEKSYSFYGLAFNSSCECNHESEDHSDGCCHDKETTIKGEYKDKLSQKTIVFNQVADFFVAPNPIVFEEYDVALTTENSLISGTKHPPDYSPPLYLLYNSLLI